MLLNEKIKDALKDELLLIQVVLNNIDDIYL